MGHREPTVETKDNPALENYVRDDVPGASVLWTLGKDMNKQNKATRLSETGQLLRFFYKADGAEDVAQ